MRNVDDGFLALAAHRRVHGAVGDLHRVGESLAIISGNIFGTKGYYIQLTMWSSAAAAILTAFIAKMPLKWRTLIHDVTLRNELLLTAVRNPEIFFFEILNRFPSHRKLLETFMRHTLAQITSTVGTSRECVRHNAACSGQHLGSFSAGASW